MGRPALQKCDDVEDFRDRRPACVRAATNDAGRRGARVPVGATLVGGSAWLWARDDLRGAVDVLVVDEAGQFSLANAVAVSPAARSLVLLGDPQQLTQPTQAIHPDGAGVSALEHLLDGARHDPARPRRSSSTETFRMHPAHHRVRVRPRPTTAGSPPRAGRERQRVSAPGALSGSGLRWVPVEHDGNTSASPQEAAVVARARRRPAAAARGSTPRAPSARSASTTCSWSRRTTSTSPACATRCREGARIGTVDKFQGQQAPVVIYSMASSSAADAPRGVWTSSTTCTGSTSRSPGPRRSRRRRQPRLLDAEVHDPEQLRAVNALCRFVELAERATTDAGAAQVGSVLRPKPPSGVAPGGRKRGCRNDHSTLRPQSCGVTYSPEGRGIQTWFRGYEQDRPGSG